MSVLELFSLSGETVVVTGAGSGLGRAIAIGAGEAGAAVVAADLNPASALATAEAISAAGGSAMSVAVDVADEASVRAMIATARGMTGRIDAIFCCAGIGGYYRRIDQMDLAEWQRVQAVNVTGTMLCAKHASAVMIEQGRGKIILIASIWGLVGSDSVPIADYAASKGAVVNLTRELALELVPLGVTVNAIAPGFFITNIDSDKQVDPAITAALSKAALELIPTHRRAEAAEIAGTAVFLASRASDMVNGHILVVDSGCVAR